MMTRPGLRSFWKIVVQPVHSQPSSVGNSLYAAKHTGKSAFAALAFGTLFLGKSRPTRFSGKPRSHVPNGSHSPPLPLLAAGRVSSLRSVSGEVRLSSDFPQCASHRRIDCTSGPVDTGYRRRTDC